MNNLVSSHAWHCIFPKFTCSITKHPPSHPSILHILRWVLYFQRFLHHLWCLLSLSTLTFSNCAWAVCVCCLLRYADTFWLDSFWPMLPDPDYVVKQSLIGWVYTNSYILVWTVLCLPVACFIYYLTVRLGFSNFFAILCAQHIILNSWLSLCLRLPYFIRMLGAHDTFTIWFTARRVLETVEPLSGLHGLITSHNLNHHHTLADYWILRTICDDWGALETLELYPYILDTSIFSFMASWLCVCWIFLVRTSITNPSSLFVELFRFFNIVRLGFTVTGFTLSLELCVF